MRAWHLWLVGIMVISCSTKHVTTSPQSDLRAVTPIIVVVVDGEGVAPSMIDELRRHLKAKLIVAGFDIESDSPEALRLDVDVHRFEPGSAALRLTVGFGAGRGSLLYTARYLAPNGQVLAQLEGQERFTGGEPHFNTEYGNFSTMGGAEKAQTVLVQEAAKHIVELGLGKAEKAEPKKQRSGARRK